VFRLDNPVEIVKIRVPKLLKLLYVSELIALIIRLITRGFLIRLWAQRPICQIRIQIEKMDHFFVADIGVDVDGQIYESGACIPTDL